MYQDNIDILIDLSGHTALNRLLTFARKPAPIQISWLGYPASTGLESMDYYLADTYSIPSNKVKNQFSEKIVRLQNMLPYNPDGGLPSINTLPALTKGYITFGTFNRPSKITRSAVSDWSDLLREVENSRLIFGGITDPWTENQFKNWFSQEGIELHRVTFKQRLNYYEYCQLHNQIDICLGAFPYSGGTTIGLALRMGVPTLVITGETFSSRAAAAHMHFAGLADFISNSREEFIAKGATLTKDIEKLSRIRNTLKENSNNKNLINRSEQFSSALDSAFREMWQKWCYNLDPVSFDITN